MTNPAAEARAADRRAYRLRVGPHWRTGPAYRDPNRGDQDTRAAGGAQRAPVACQLAVTSAGLTTDQPGKVRCPDCRTWLEQQPRATGVTFHRAGRGRVTVRLDGEQIGVITDLLSAWRYDGQHGPLARTYLRDLRADVTEEITRREN